MFTTLSLPNGSILPNLLAKAAMEENMADVGQVPGPALHRLYQLWAQVPDLPLQWKADNEP
ncbi:hypothetical protein ACUTSW_19535 [Serratia sp. TSA_198.1]|jgi:2,4-dienoyl-CoA reductase-like NADH-dependent reductase (Old Yellow Enzyme family)|uniref:hypothetical protein n=1 Tax=Serratia sp. TSA_198.1 TaxID=3415664 RepID=UPI0040462D6B